MQGMIERFIKTKLIQNINQFPSVAIIGARQVGKTTLARSLATDSVYLDLEKPEDLSKLSEPMQYLSRFGSKLVILDEIQRAPNVFNILRVIIDENIHKGIKTSQFLLLGSASMSLLKQSSESLAGRIAYVEMSGFNLLELTASNNKLEELWLKGGFPDSYLSINDDLAMNYLENFIKTYLERDIPQYGFKIPATRLRRLWTMLAHLQGEAINYSKLASNLDVDAKTVSTYVDILESLLLLRRINPYFVNIKKRLVKSPRIYIRDSGITHRLLGINSFDALLSNPILGKSWEAFVLENICSVLPNFAEIYYYRTTAGAEIDFIIKFSYSKLWAVEVKYSCTPSVSKYFNNICKELKVSKKFVIYSGKETYSISNNINVYSLEAFLKEIVNNEST